MWWVTLAWAGGSFAVVASGAPDEAAIRPLLDVYAEANLPSHPGYPKAVLSAAFPGLPETTAWTLLIAQPTDREVADRLAAHVTAMGLAAKVWPIEGGEPEKLQLLSLDRFTASGNGAPLYVYDVCVTIGPDRGACLSRARPDPDTGKLVVPLPILPKGTRFSLWADAGKPWQCGSLDAGPAKSGVPNWLHGPMQATCFAPDEPTAKKHR